MKSASCTPFLNCFILLFACQDNISEALEGKAKLRQHPGAEERVVFPNQGRQVPAACLVGNGWCKGMWQIVTLWYLGVDNFLCLDNITLRFDSVFVPFG
jgi:hypothetical protein